MKRKQIYPYIFLTCLALIMVVVIIPSKNIFGSNTDWLSQHVNIADYLRQLILDNKSIFPDFAFNLGAGQNIYNFSYYGLLRPDILLSCLFPFIEIKNIIIIPRKVKSSLAGFSSENGSIIWIRRKMVRERPAGEGSRDIAIISAKRKVIC